MLYGEMRHRELQPFFFERVDDAPTDPYIRLSLKVLDQAVEDYIYLLETGKVPMPQNCPKKLGTLESIEDFFNTDWAEMLALGKYSSSYMLKMLRAIKSAEETGGEAQH